MTSGSKIKAIRRENAMMPGAAQRPAVVNINPATLVDATCPKCEGAVFVVGYQVKLLPATHPRNPTGREQRLKSEILLCEKCGTIL